MRNVNKRALESLIKAGCLDGVAGSSEARGSLLMNLDRIMNMAQSALKLKETGQSTMFDMFGEEVATPLSGIDLTSAPVPRAEVLSWEKEMLGIWLSEHPFTHAAPHLAHYVSVLCNEVSPEHLGELPAQGRDFVMAGIVGSTRRLTTRDGRSFIAAEIQDLSGAYEVTVWPDVYERTQDYWLPGSILLMQVRIRERGDRLNAGVQDVVRFEEGFLPPVWAMESAPVVARSNGNGANGHAAPAAIDRADMTSDDPADEDLGPPPDAFGFEQPPEEPDRTPVEAPAAAYEPPIAPQPVHRECLRLVLHEGEDEAGDQKRLSSVFRLLQERPGRDEVYLTIKTREGETVELRMPTAALDEGLKAQLEAAVGMVREPQAV